MLHIKNDPYSKGTPRLRLRTKTTKNHDLLPKHVKDIEYQQWNNSKKIRVLPSGPYHFLLCIALSVSVYALIATLEKNLPDPITISNEHKYVDRFIAERAKNYLVNLTSKGPRPVGSEANEIFAIQMLLDEVKTIIYQTHSSHKIEWDLQRVSGSFSLDFLDGMTNVYRNVQNVIVKIGPVDTSRHSLLINCHFDSVMDSPGASDDGASCAIMLELLRVISRLNKPLKNNIIFLFNGAEENMMQASHGFITQHKWASSIRAFINMEACGSGGKELLFQVGPNHPWLLEAYSDTVPYPLASSMAQEIFQSGIIPGDTDYRIFRDFGRVSGLDFAWSANGYVYHTKLDTVDKIPLGTFQRTGDNMLPLILKLVNSNKISNIEKYSNGNLVFFDFLGLFIIHWSEDLSDIINICVIIISFFVILHNANHNYVTGYTAKDYFKSLLKCSGLSLLIWLVTLGTIALLSLCIVLFGCCLSWFSQPAWLFFLYIIPTMLVPLLVYVLFGQKCLSGQQNIQCPKSLLYCISRDGNQLLFITILLLCVLLHIRSGFVIALFVVCNMISTLLQNVLLKKNYGHTVLWLHFGCMLIPFILSAYMINAALLLVVPIMGRSGSGNHAETVMSLITSAMFTLVYSFYSPLVFLIRKVNTVFISLTLILLTSLLVLVFTPFGFPYSGDSNNLAPQRYMVSHVERSFYYHNGSLRDTQNGLWIVDLDVNSPHSIKNYVPELANARQISHKECSKELYCGLPYFLPVITFIWQTHWIDSEPLDVKIPLNLKLMYRDQRLNNIQRLSLTVNGPDHITMVISPYNDVKLKDWSVSNSKPFEGPRWNGRPTYFIYYSCANDIVPWDFWVDLEVPKGHTGPQIEVGLSGHRMHGSHKTTTQLQKFLKQLPQWTTTTDWSSSYKSYTL
ncbi:endoplasmic reticulum metallopeptidase 1-like [Adelges cooleyi]|uniref:endoplasmic reticulum metallopeptidase 1-like n=1 Tax=Adelges cooleyi TaxID=133065 RepID=UPI00217F311B|nr:endoplasmic reticulum metallopeptidase 1-like [Adelges cooleyi]XP_050425476.1 endoplasmic reticulum metallopeptidase 1-like [Adelges cooleyi]XP_050425478.1 endoplasmic reticulum metallopeptidase 1-like [Adelges cooleyi]XP_050425479.1 endoplasmic reticulum metallopeptidase 1-like [Adelges cooleyi]XP_050425480.1 endoplasmic reticulum metallopeptidase 1-like [Adelges cooleyi]